jgi:hypothetical protein
MDGFNATAWQIRQAYEKYFKRPLENNTYEGAAQELIKAMGLRAAREYILSQPNTID